MNDLSDYERLRQENLKQNMKILSELGLMREVREILFIELGLSVVLFNLCIVRAHLFCRRIIMKALIPFCFVVESILRKIKAKPNKVKATNQNLLVKIYRRPARHPTKKLVVEDLRDWWASKWVPIPIFKRMYLEILLIGIRVGLKC